MAMPDALYVPDRDLSRAELIDELAAMPARLRAIVAPADAAALTRRAEGEWSALETLRHFRDIAQVYGGRFKWMILDDDPFLPNYDEDRWVADSPDGPADAPALLDEIAATVRLLRALPPEGWARTGRHEVFGRVELEHYLRHEYAHEEQHLAQIAAALAV
jgi:hypothetical protein